MEIFTEAELERSLFRFFFTLSPEGWRNAGTSLLVSWRDWTSVFHLECFPELLEVAAVAWMRDASPCSYGNAVFRFTRVFPRLFLLLAFDFFSIGRKLFRFPLLSLLRFAYVTGSRFPRERLTFHARNFISVIFFCGAVAKRKKHFWEYSSLFFRPLLKWVPRAGAKLLLSFYKARFYGDVAR